MADPRSKIAWIAGIGFGVIAIVVLKRWREHAPAVPPPPDATPSAIDAAPMMALEETDGPVAEVEADAGADDAGATWDEVLAAGTLGDAGLPARRRPACTEAIKARAAAREAWLERERQRLAPKLATPAGARALGRRLRWVRERVDLTNAASMCSDAPSGSWELRLTGFSGTVNGEAQPDSPAPEGDSQASEPVGFDVVGRLEVRFRAKGGAQDAAPFRPDYSMKSDTGDSAEVAYPVDVIAGDMVSDADSGAAEPALLVHVERGHIDLIDSNPKITEETFLFAFRGGKIVASDRLPADLPVDDLRDVDGDGLSDLMTPGPFVGKLPTAIDPDNLVRAAGPLLVAHAQKDGAFSLDDAVAVAHARRLCPIKPARITLPFEEERSTALDLWRDGARELVVCARLWGLPSAQVSAALRPFHALAAWATVKPPLTLR